MVKIADTPMVDITITVWGYRAKRFASLLSASGLSVAEFAERVGKGPATVARWGEKVPEYALAYLELWAVLKKYIEHVVAMEGSAFIDGYELHFDAAVWAELDRIYK